MPNTVTAATEITRRIRVAQERASRAGFVGTAQTPGTSETLGSLIPLFQSYTPEETIIMTPLFEGALNAVDEKLNQFQAIAGVAPNPQLVAAWEPSVKAEMERAKRALQRSHVLAKKYLEEERKIDAALALDSQNAELLRKKALLTQIEAFFEQLALDAQARQAFQVQELEEINLGVSNVFEEATPTVNPGPTPEAKGAAKILSSIIELFKSLGNPQSNPADTERALSNTIGSIMSFITQMFGGLVKLLLGPSMHATVDGIAQDAGSWVGNMFGGAPAAPAQAPAAAPAAPAPAPAPAPAAPIPAPASRRAFLNMFNTYRTAPAPTASTAPGGAPAAAAAMPIDPTRVAAQLAGQVGGMLRRALGQVRPRP